MNEAQIEVDLLRRFAAVIQVVDDNADDPETMATLRAALGTLFSRVTLSPGVAGWDDGGTYVNGHLDLVPTLHEDVVPTRKGGGWVWGPRAQRPTPLRSEHARSRRG